MHDCDVLIVGAGAAGLAAAARLAAAGKYVCVLEARDRLGGRIYTRADACSGAMLELGAEFIHGTAPAIMRWLERAGVPVIDAAHERWSLRDGRLVSGDALFDRMRAGLDKIGAPRKDLPFAEFLAAHPRELPKPVREFACMLVEGFDAADATRVSTMQTLAEWAGQSGADAPTFRPLGGYAGLVGALADALDPERALLYLNTVVSGIRWRRGRVSIDATRLGRLETFTAPRAIVTLPLGVLQSSPESSGAVHFDPPLKAKAAAFQQLVMGPVLKVVLQFRTRLWEHIDEGRYRNATFFHASGAAFRTAWTLLPVRAAVISAWAAGPAAHRLAQLDDAELANRALDSLETMFGAKARVREQLRGASVHNWQTDPFARGAYSYVLAGGSNARKDLARPLSGALYFAGEAADVQGESGTVAGALQSGERAAAEVLRK